MGSSLVRLARRIRLPERDPPRPSNILPLGERWRRYLSRGARSLEEGEYHAAAEAFEKALEAAPEEPQVLLAVGRERMRQGRFDDAEGPLRQACAALPESTAAAAALARLLGLHQGKPQEAYQVLHRALEHCQDTAALHVVRGELLLEEGAFAEARAAFGRAMDDPVAAEAARIGMARTYNIEGINLSEQGQCEPAIFSFKRAADLEPGWSGPYVNMGVVLSRLGKKAKAMEAYATALERDPTNPVAHFNLGNAQHELGLLGEAVRTFEELMMIAPDYPHVRGALANVLGEMKEFDRAIALLLEELECDARCVSCWTSLGLAYICTGNPERGEQCLRRALELDPRYFNAIHNLATLYVTQQRYDEAERVLREAFRLDPRRTVELLAQGGQLDAIRQMERFRFLE
jgi:protein O-GlcNAc transferase